MTAGGPQNGERHPFSDSIPWIEYRERGFYCVPGDFYLDPSRAVPRAAVTHAHADHFPRGLGEVWATAPTLAIAEARYLNTAGKRRHELIWSCAAEIGPVKVTPYPAGHMLGSAQLLLEYEGQKVLFSGDIAFQDNPTCRALEHPGCSIDLLICEATFAEKGDHPEPDQALREIMMESASLPVLAGVYAAGKAQRLNAMLTRDFPEIPVFVTGDIMRVHRMYEAQGMNVGRWRPYRRQDVRNVGKYILLAPPRILTGYNRDIRYFKVMASGWDFRERMGFLNGQLELSDHASREELMEYVRRNAAARTLFWHGDASGLAAACREAGFEASFL